MARGEDPKGFLRIFIFRISFRILGNLDMVDPSSLDTFPNQIDYLILLVVAVYAMFGILDDYIELRHRYKMLVPFFFALPLTTTMHIHVWQTPLGTIDLTQALITIPQHQHAPSHPPETNVSSPIHTISHITS